MDSPFRYTLITLFFASVMLSIIFMMSWYSMGRRHYALLFAVSFMLSAALWAVNLGKTWFPTHEVYWMVATTLSLSAVIVGTWGHCLRVKRYISPKFYVGFALLGVMLTSYFTLFSPHVGLQMSLYLYIDVLFLTITAVVIYQYRPKPNAAEIGASIVHLGFALSLFIAASIALSQGAQFNAERVHWYAVVNFTSLPAAYVGMSVFVLYMLAADLAEEMKHLTLTDQLTSCLNRRGFYEMAMPQIEMFQQKNQHVCLIYLDIDNFKRINDKHGHCAGDTVLSTVANRLKTNIKSTDLMGRMGGEEFVILIGRASYQETFEVAERLRQVLAATPVQFNQKPIEVTASFGVVDINAKNVNLEQAINLADDALYQAKAKGRNQVVHSNNLHEINEKSLA